MLTTDRARGLGRAAVLVVVVLACTGCRLSLTLDVDVDRNGGGTLAMAVAADAQLLERANQAGADPLAQLAASELDGWRVADATDDTGERTVSLSTSFDDPGQLEELADELVAALTAREVVLLSGLSVDVTDEQVSVAGTAAAVPLPGVREYGVSPARAVRLLERTEALRYRVTVTPPGEVLDGNADEVDGDALVWDVAPGETVEFAVASTRPGPPILPAILASVGGAVLAVSVLRLVLVRRRRRSARGRSAG